MESSIVQEKIQRGEWITFENKCGKSKAWKCFLKVKTNLNEPVPLVICKFCEKSVKFGRNLSTTNLMLHKCFKNKFVSSLGPSEISNKRSRIELNDELKKEVTNACVDFVTKDLRSFEAVAGAGFKSFTKKLIEIGARTTSKEHSLEFNIDDTCILPHPTTVSRQVKNEHQKELRRFVEKIRPIIMKGECASTMDIWTEECTQLSYLTFTVHFIDDEWELHSRVFFTIMLEKFDKDGNEQSITGDLIKANLKNKFIELGLGEDCLTKFIYTTDQGSNIIKALKECERLNCSAHLLNTVLRNTFESSNLTKNAKSVLDMINKCKSLVEYLKRTGKKQMLFHNVVQDCSTRWNTKFDMLISIEKNFDDIENILATARESHRISCVDRQLLNKVIMVLEPFKIATKELEKDKFPTLCKVLFRIVILKDQLHKMLQVERNDDLKFVLKHCADVVIPEKFKFLDLHKISALFWPSLKQQRYLENEEFDCDHCWNVLHSKTADISSETSLSIGSSSPTTSSASGSSTSAEFLDSLNSLHSEETYYNQYKDVNTSSENAELKIEIECYRNYSNCNLKPNDILNWWKAHSSQFPYLSKLARKYLAIPATSASSERSFSTAGRIIEKRRTRLAPQNLDAILFLHSAGVDA